MKHMKLTIILTIFLIFIGGCSIWQDSSPKLMANSTNTTDVTHIPSGTQELILNEQDLQQLGMISNGTDCLTEEYQTGAYSSLAQYSFCSYILNSLNNTEVIIELKKFANLNDLNGTYQYESLHYRSSEGLLSENTYGDQSRFYINNENDYGGQFNDPNIYYYTLYIVKDVYLIHVTSKGNIKIEENIAEIGRQILLKFE